MLRDSNVEGCNLSHELSAARIIGLELVGFIGELVNLGQELLFINIHDSSFLLSITESWPRSGRFAGKLFMLESVEIR